MLDLYKILPMWKINFTSQIRYIFCIYLCLYYFIVCVIFNFKRLRQDGSIEFAFYNEANTYTNTELGLKLLKLQSFQGGPIWYDTVYSSAVTEAKHIS